MNKRRVGNIGEALAASYLESAGVKILCQNFKSYRRGEIDIIGNDNGTLIFVEVKYRSSKRAGYAVEAVSANKIRLICQASDFFRARYGICDNMPCRFDVVSIEGPLESSCINWYKNAFEYVGNG